MSDNFDFEPFDGDLSLSSEDLGAFAHGFDERLQGIEEQIADLQRQVKAMRQFLSEP